MLRKHRPGTTTLGELYSITACLIHLCTSERHFKLLKFASESIQDFHAVVHQQLLKISFETVAEKAGVVGEGFFKGKESQRSSDA